jgi:hypothetical protein
LRATENQAQQANFGFVDGEISIPHHPNGIVPDNALHDSYAMSVRGFRSTPPFLKDRS